MYFAAPELLNAKVYTGPEVDVWSFGIVLYVLVCGKVPFDDQSMPALHAKIKRGQVEYPAWLTAGESRRTTHLPPSRLLRSLFTECKHLLSRMLVTNPANRATLQEVAQHPWMTKGYDGAPNNHLPVREPIRYGELDPDVIKEMTGFEFGTPEEIENKMGDVLTSDQYLNALAIWDEKQGRTPAGMSRSISTERLSVNKSPDFHKSRSPSKRFSGLGFYGKKITGNLAAAFSGRHEDSLLDGMNGINGKHAPQTTGAGGVKTDLTDPTRGYHPLLSIYYLVRERMERDRLHGSGVFASSTLSLNGPPSATTSSMLSQANGTKPSKSSFGARDGPALSLMPPAPAATINRDSKLIQPPASPRPMGPPQSPAPDKSNATPTLPPPSAAEETYLNRRGSSNRHRRNTTMPTSAPVSPAPMQGGFRRTAAPDVESPIAEESAPLREAHASAPAAHRHSMHIPSSFVRPTTAASQTSDHAATSSSPSSGGFVKRFGSILGRSHGDGENKKIARQRNGAGTTSPGKDIPSLQQAHDSPPTDSDVPLPQPASGKSVNRASTTGAALSSPSSRMHTRGASVDAGSPTTAAHAAASGPPIGVDRRRQASMSLASRRPKTTGSLALAGVLPEADENENPDNVGGQDLFDQNGPSESKPVYLKVRPVVLREILQQPNPSVPIRAFSLYLLPRQSLQRLYDKLLSRRWISSESAIGP